MKCKCVDKLYMLTPDFWKYEVCYECARLYHKQHKAFVEDYMGIHNNYLNEKPPVTKQGEL